MSNKIEYIAYEGDANTIEWYFDENLESQALDYFYSLSAGEQRKLLMLFKRMGDIGVIMDKTKFRNEGDKIYAFKPQPDRFLCFFFEGQKIVVTNAFRKKQDKLPNNEKEKALKFRRDFIKRIQAGNYYE